MQVSQTIKKITPYKAGKPISELVRELGLDNAIKLASNERPEAISDNIKKAIVDNLVDINRYPDNNCFS